MGEVWMLGSGGLNGHEIGFGSVQRREMALKETGTSGDK